MKYVIVGGICLMVGALIGVFTLALVSINRVTGMDESIIMPEEDTSENR